MTQGAALANQGARSRPAAAARGLAPEAGTPSLVSLQRVLLGQPPSPQMIAALQRTLGNQGIRQMAMSQPGTDATRAAQHLAQNHHDQGDLPLQRHSSWEHRMLGDTDPRKLAMMGATQDVGNGLFVGNDDAGYETITRQHVTHALEEEIEKLKQFRESALFKDRQVSLETAEKAEEQIRAWGMVPVRVDMAGGGYEVLTYGEVNTLPDLFGNIAEMKQHDPKNFHELVQGIRQQSLYSIQDVYEKFGGEKEKRNAFKGAKGSTGSTILPKFMQVELGPATKLGPGVMGELELMGQLGMTGKKGSEGKKEQSYTAGLARNACHFAPESWHSWAESHQKAVLLGIQAFTKGEEAKAFRKKAADDPKSADGYNGLANQADKEAARLSNEALLQNGFGDHFLQDSFAAGHLINKTEIMKMYVKWLDANPQYAEGVAVFWNPFKSREMVPRTRRKPKTAEAWAPAAAMAQQGGLGVGEGRYDVDEVGQMKPNDPQSVENMEGSWEDRFTALGLTMPGSAKVGTQSQKFLAWWQGQVLATPDAATLAFNAKSIAQMEKATGITQANISVSLINLAGDQIVAKEGNDTYTLRENWRPGTSRAEARKFKAATKTGGSARQQAKRKEDYERAAKRATLKDYHTFLNSALLQAATNVLHDIFCKSGLKVASNAEDLPYKIYGDDAMLQGESSKGVEISAITSNMSRDNILSTIATGKEKYGITTIANRFPSKVEADALGQKQIMSLEAWHTNGALQSFCETKAFPTAAFDIIKGWKVASDDELQALAEEVSKDQLKQTDHSGEAF